MFGGLVEAGFGTDIISRSCSFICMEKAMGCRYKAFVQINLGDLDTSSRNSVSHEL